MFAFIFQVIYFSLTSFLVFGSEWKYKRLLNLHRLTITQNMFFP